MLWGAAAARCEFDGCNKKLSRSPVTQERVNIAERAHIWAFSKAGSRGNSGIAKDLTNSEQNLLLMCHDCHRTIDQHKSGGRYTPELLQQWKTDHEARIDLVTGVCPRKRTHVLLYGANIGGYSSPLRMDATAPAVFPSKYPASMTPLAIGTRNSAFFDRDADFWRIEEATLRRQFRDVVEHRRVQGDVEHLSVFGLAPQPLLVLLGALLTDLQPADVYQLKREPQSWAWDANERELGLRVSEPKLKSRTVALVLGLSATITEDRVHRVLGADAAVWHVNVDGAHNDVLRTRDQLREFRASIRRLFDAIKAVHGQQNVVHIFPAVPVAAAVELGRVRMPKADAPWVIYDQVNQLGGFVEAIRLGDEAGGQRSVGGLE